MRRAVFTCVFLLLQAGNARVLCAAKLSLQKVDPASAPPSLRGRPDKASGSFVLDVVVTDRSNNAVPGLSGQSFSLLEDKKQTPPGTLRIMSPSSSETRESHETILVIDAVNSSLEQVDRSEDQIKAFLRADGGHLQQPTTILILSDSEPRRTAAPPGSEQDNVVALLHRGLFVHRIPASLDGSTLIRAIEANKATLHRILEAQGTTGESERVRLSLEALNFIATAEAERPGAKLLIWISPGWPPLAQSSAKTKEQLFDTVIYFANLLREARIILYSVDPRGVTAGASIDVNGLVALSNQARNQSAGHASTLPNPVNDTYYENFLEGVTAARQSNPNDLALQVLAYQSGGLVLTHSNDLEAEIARCARDASALYTFTYTPEKRSASYSYHRLDVRLNQPALSVRTRKGFYYK